MNKTGKVVKCAYCGKERYKPTCLLTKHNFCCLACRYAWQSGRPSGRKLVGSYIKCATCGKLVYRHKYRIKTGRTYYCNKPACRKLSVTIKCDMCGNAVNVYPWEIKEFKYHFCSLPCRYTFFKGARSTRWQGGICNAPYTYNFNKSLKYTIRSRFKFTCQECGYTEKQLDYPLSIHHIDFNKKNNDVMNLIPLCASCHGKTQWERDTWIKYYKNKMEEYRNV